MPRNALYSRDVDGAVRMFQEMGSHDVDSWSAVISSHAEHACARTEALPIYLDK
jgi:hypothetical protein